MLTTDTLLAAARVVADAAEPYRDDRTPPLAEAIARIPAWAIVRPGGALSRQKAAPAPSPDAQKQVSYGS
jgi:hypothetical protein